MEYKWLAHFVELYLRYHILTVIKDNLKVTENLFVVFGIIGEEFYGVEYGAIP